MGWENNAHRMDPGSYSFFFEDEEGFAKKIWKLNFECVPL
jgi:hypothetical protein